MKSGRRNRGEIRKNKEQRGKIKGEKCEYLIFMFSGEGKNIIFRGGNIVFGPAARIFLLVRYFNSVIRDEPEAIDAVQDEEKITISLLIHEAYSSFHISSEDIEKLR
jgi:hypothetical protein